MGGLRERTRRRTRAEISAAAMRLFLERGFDAVTVAEVAAAARVSEKTVYNHFPTKAELVFDAEHDLLADLLAAVRNRPVGCSVVSAVRRFLIASADRVGEGAPPEAQRAFRRLVTESPTLRAYQRRMAARYEHALAQVLAEETGAPPGSPEPFLAAVGLVGGLRAGYECAELSTGQAGARTEATERALALLEAGLGDYALKRPPAEPS
jgi:AcrR family transcriptional regulator